MLTPVLEKLILQGKASFNTFVIGGGDKYVLNVKKERYIIITDIHYQPSVNVFNPDATNQEAWFRWDDITQLLYNNLNTQLKVFSTKSNNSFVFRNNINVTPLKTKSSDDYSLDRYLINPSDPIKLDTYLIHESDVSFTMSKAGAITINENGNTPADSIGFPPPFDYGKEGQLGVVKVRLSSLDAISPDYGAKQAGDYLDQVTNFPGGNLEFIFPVDQDHQLPDIDRPASYPLINISYVEIQGNITNIQATL